MKFLRFLPLVVGLGFLAMDFGMWHAGTPPAWSFLAPRGEAVVRASRVDVERIGNGTLRYTPAIEVDAGDGAVALQGTWPSFFGFGSQEAEEIAARFPVGATIVTRPLDGVLYADRIDPFDVGIAVFMGGMSLFVCFLGLLLAGVPMRFVGRTLAALRREGRDAG
ncbi:MAG: hypothetical protein H6825_07920 [Planctomycetes bacterium]|nr:hypothetical protein [Planctomycetota bacterium]